MTNSSRHYEKKDGIALWSVFPTPATLTDFERNDPNVSKMALPAFIRFAHEKELIAEAAAADFRSWVRDTADRRIPQTPPVGFSFNDLIEKMTEKQSVNRLVEDELLPIARRFHLPDVQTSMISRLRKHFKPNTRPKQNLLRVLSFWIGLNRPHWGWNFETLVRLGDSAPISVQTDREEGVRMAVHVMGRGDLLGPAAVEWLREELIRSMKYLDMFYIDAKQVVTAATTVLVNIPRLKGHPADLTLYGRALGNAAALAHQMLIRWDLSEFSGPGNRLTIAIAAGPFVEMEMYIQTILKARSPDGGMIRLTPFAYLCANLSEIKMVFHRPPLELSLFDGDTMTVWSVHCLWSHIYYNYVPAVLRILPTDDDSYRTFKASLFSADLKNNAALASVYRHVRNTLLTIEIAKSCLTKGMFHEADYFIAIILAIHPFHVVARTLRMVIRLNMALYRPGFGAAGRLFRDAVNEGRFIIDQCQVADEEVFCELGQVYFCIARRLFNILGNGSEGILQAEELCGRKEDRSPRDDTDVGEYEFSRRMLREKVMEYLQQAEDCFDKGRTLSPSGMGNRSLHWCFRIRALKKLFLTDDNLFAPDSGPPRIPTDREDVFRKIAKEMFYCLGWADDIPRTGEGYSPDEEAALFFRIFQAFDRYDNSVLLSSYSANVKYAFAILVYDFVPRLTVGLLRMILAWLDASENATRELLNRKSGIHTIVTCYSQIQPADALLDRIRKAVGYLREQYADDLNRADDWVIEKGREMKFTLINFTEEFFAERPFF
jgi:hypothetical protein